MLDRVEADIELMHPTRPSQVARRSVRSETALWYEHEIQRSFGVTDRYMVHNEQLREERIDGSRMALVRLGRKFTLVIQ
jgi:hypothetical protein